MRDALGGIVNIQMILIFIAIVSGYLAFSVNYTKAFRVKDFIISRLEEYENYKTFEDREVKEKINNYILKVGYNGPDEIPADACKNTDSDKEGILREGNGYAICEYEALPTKKIGDGPDGKPVEQCYKRVYYRVVTYINVDIPVVNKIMSSFKFFRIEGESRLIFTGDTTGEDSCLER